MATFRHQMANVVSASYTLVRFSLKKFCFPKNFSFWWIERFSPNVVVDMDKQSKIQIGKCVSVHSGGRISAIAGGSLEIGDNTSMNVNCILTCRHEIILGKNVSIGPGVMFFDHDHIMGKYHGVKDTPFNLRSIHVGDGTWIGAGSIILSGTTIGRNCVIAAGSVVKGNIPDGTLLIQKRENTYKEVK